jgi:hypothetical protein
MGEAAILDEAMRVTGLRLSGAIPYFLGCAIPDENQGFALDVTLTDQTRKKLHQRFTRIGSTNADNNRPKWVLSLS